MANQLNGTLLADIWAEFLTVYPIVLTVDTGRYFIAAGVMAALIWGLKPATLWARRIQDRQAKYRDVRREILASLRTAAIFSGIGFTVYLGAKWEIFTVYDDFSVRGPLYMVGTLALMLVAHDAYFYWTHRAMHHPKLFRAFHRTHHKSHTPTPWAAYAFDWPEALAQAVFLPGFLSIVPCHDMTVFLWVTTMIVRNVMGHAGFEVHARGWLDNWFLKHINTTTHHDLHHSAAHCNYSLYFTWWDQWMGTEHPEYKETFDAVIAQSVAQSDAAARNKETAHA
jgi:sterol desaturase/sphingolipid hydroxylase (fatty acid hydroxylase superfamily)